MEEKITIGNYTISDIEIDQFIATLSQEQQMYKSVPQFRAQVKERLEEIALFAMDGEEKCLDQSEEFQAAMKITRRDMLGQLAMSKAIEGVEVDEAEAKNYYENNKELFGTPATVSAKHILVDSEDKINEIKNEIDTGAKSFEDAAREYSTCPSGKKGGDLGTFGKGQMVKEFETAAFEGEIKKVIGPVKTQFGYHLIWVDERSESEIEAFENIKEKAMAQLKREKQQEAYDNRIQELRKKFL